ncbi:hypothetical protein [Streptococcus pseudopneumoniae]|uniref:hypothetical protein n=1 Tax=Streptococcus pseudopneumoniae TaxID=257758 RepID=UPI0018B05959|nr:hypothetical protein [Streptococcus pseudopneumoniae]MBF9645455.1 hypothetical protein [Streptococcus pseudopneumoniae]
MIDWARKHALAWTTSAAVTLAAMRFFTPSFVDFIIDGLTVALVWLAAVLAKQATK